MNIKIIFTPYSCHIHGNWHEYEAIFMAAVCDAAITGPTMVGPFATGVVEGLDMSARRHRPANSGRGPVAT